MPPRSPEPGPDLTGPIIGLAIKVHRKLGPGLLESVYLQCLCRELRNTGLPFDIQIPLALIYEDLRIDNGYRADIIVGGTTLLELKSGERLLPVHAAQTLTYLKLSGCRVALLMNFNTALLKDGLRCFIG
jgi:GxxExxY protein